jgi:peptide/nickel transport system substrate-binding protein
VSLFVNLNKWPMNNVAVRKAISLGINRQILSQDAEAGYEPVATSNTGLVLPRDQQYLPADASGNTLPFDQNAAKQVLQQAGFTMVGGVWSLNGKSVTFNVEDPTSYTDYATAAQAIARDLSAIGMKVTFDGVSANQWNSDVANGTFDTAIHWSSSGPTPFYMYQNWLDPTLAPAGQAATGDYERYTDPDATQYLNQFQSSGDPAVQKQAIQGLGSIVANKLPIIPLMYGVAWGEFNSAKVTGWPSADNPYMPAQPAAPFDEYTVLQLKAK